MNIKYTYNPMQFFSINLLYGILLCPLGFYLSYNNLHAILLPLILIGLSLPAITSIRMIYSSKNKELITEFWNKLHFNKINIKFFLTSLYFIPNVLFLATTISLLFGESINQFTLSNTINILSGQGVFSLLILFLAPLCEELGWRGYGVDSLRAYYTLFKTSIIFGIFWTLWHIPLFFIKDYYPNQLLHINSFYAINYIVSIFLGSFLLNWIYYKNNKSIWAVIFFHFTMNLFAVLFQTTQLTKCIITALIGIILIIIIFKDKDLFFNSRRATPC